MALTVAALLLFALLEEHSSIAFIVAGLVVIGLGLALFLLFTVLILVVRARMKPRLG
jgi:hypothetical protein